MWPAGGVAKPHPNNAECYFSEPCPQKYAEIKRTTAAGGIRDPLKVLPDYNREQRYCQNAIGKAKRAQYLRRYWGVREEATNPPGTVAPREGQTVPVFVHPLYACRQSGCFGRW